MLQASVIILAGGQSSRFIKSTGKNKVFYKIKGKSMIERVVNLVNKSNNIIISVNDQITKNKITAELKRDDIQYAIDDERCKLQGPLRGIYSSLPFIHNEIVLILPVDYPYLDYTTIDNLFAELHDNDIAIYSEITGRLHNLIMLVRKRILTEIDMNIFPTSRVSNILRMAKNVSILVLHSEFKQLLNMNTHLESSRIDNLSYTQKKLQTNCLFHKYLESKDIEILKSEIIIWKGYSVVYQIEKDIDKIKLEKE